MSAAAFPRGITQAALAALLSLPSLAEAQRSPSPLDGLGPTIASAFSGAGLVMQAGAVASTAGLSLGGVDHRARVLVQTRLASPSFGDAMVLTGYVLPVVVAPGLYAAGLASGDARLAGAGAAAIQALVLTTGETFALKWITGRPFPLHGGDPRAPDRLDHPEYAREFTFWPPTSNRGVAWPSGHTSASIAIAASLSSCYRDVWWVPLLTYPFAAAIAAGMLSGDHHWASDVVAGALVGQSIGWASGEGLRRGEQGGARASVLVRPSRDGIAVQGVF